MIQTATIDWLPVGIQEIIENARQLRLNEEEMFREILHGKQQEVDRLHEELYRTKEQLHEVQKIVRSKGNGGIQRCQG